MKTKIQLLASTILSAIVIACNLAPDPTQFASITHEIPDHPGDPVTDSSPLAVGDLDINPPVQSGNLQVFLITGKDELGDKSYVTLGSAMEKGWVTVHETGNVNQLAITNHSDHHIFIHSGDIVKGGKQDRTMGQDVIIPPNSDDVPIQSFCVERGRWTNRGNENVKEFSSSDKMLSSKDLKMAAKYESNQGQVWANVSREQQKLSKKVSEMSGEEVEVANQSSASSLQLTLENEKLDEIRTAMAGQFNHLAGSNADAIGFAYAINGEIYGIDIYNNQPLFEELWTKISEAIITEAIANHDSTIQNWASVADVAAFIENGDAHTEEHDSEKINEQTGLKTQENETGHVVFNVIDRDEKNWIHKNYMKKSEETPKVVPSQEILREHIRN